MTDGTVMVIEFISGFELFNTRPYHNYETWGQGYRVSGLGIKIEREDLDDAIAAWSAAVIAKRKGEAVNSWELLKSNELGCKLLEDWITDPDQPSWKDGLSK